MATGGYIRLSQFMSAHQLLQSLQIPAINTQQVYSLAGATSQTITAQDSAYRGSVGMDWFERGTARCDEVGLFADSPALGTSIFLAGCGPCWLVCAKLSACTTFAAL